MDNAIAMAIRGIGVNAWPAMAAAPAFSAAVGDVVTARLRTKDAPLAPASTGQRVLFSQIAPGSTKVSQRIPQ